MTDYSNFTIAFNPLPNGNFGDLTVLTMEASKYPLLIAYTYQIDALAIIFCSLILPDQIFVEIRISNVI
jgi:hypothetical protein